MRLFSRMPRSYARLKYPSLAGEGGRVVGSIMSPEPVSLLHWSAARRLLLAAAVAVLLVLAAWWAGS